MDLPAPVATQIRTPDPQQSLNTFSGILGLQQQRQQLQIGAANVYQAQRQAQEMKAGSELMRDPVGSGLVDEDGNPTKNAYNIIKSRMPTTGDAHYKNLLEAAGGRVQLQQASLGLDNDTASVLSSRLAGLTADKRTTNSDVLNEFDDIRDQFSGSANSKRVNKILDVIQKGYGRVIQENPTKDGTLDPKAQQYFQGLSRGFLGNAGITGVGGVGLPAGGQNAAGQQINRNPITGAVEMAPAGPGASVSTPQVAKATATAVGGASADVERSTQISQSVQPSRQAVTLSEQISNLADQVHTGKFSKAVTDYMATIGQDNPTIAARQLISKYAAQLKTVAIANAPTDTARNQIDAGFPDPEHMSPEAIKGASEYIRGSMLMNLSRAKLAREYAQKRGGDTSGLRYADDSLTQNADPLMYTYQHLKPGAERQEFIKRHFQSADQAREFVQRKNAVEHYGGFEQ